MPRVRDLLGDVVKLVWFGDDTSDAQFAEHNCCEYMQQYLRKLKEAARNKKQQSRCDYELRKFFSSCLEFFTDGHESTRENIGPTVSPQYTDSQVIQALQYRFPAKRSAEGWDSKFIDSLLEKTPAKKARGA